MCTSRRQSADRRGVPRPLDGRGRPISVTKLAYNVAGRGAVTECGCEEASNRQMSAPNPHSGA